jgi:hypothetical protein
MKNFSYLLLVLLLTGCTKEKIIESEKEHRWKAHNGFSYQQAAVLNSYATDDKLYLIGRSFYTLSDSLREDGGYPAITLLNYGFNIDYKMPIKDLLYVYSFGDRFINVIPTKNTVNYVSNGSFSINMKDRDSDFSEFNFIAYWSGECMKINNQNQILIPYKTYNNKVILSFLLMEIKVDQEFFNGEDKADTLKTRIIKLEDETGITSLFSTKEDFIVSAARNTYKIKSDGAATKVFDGVFSRIFQENDTLYGISSGKIYRSVDNGASWPDNGDISNDFSLLINFCLIDHEIIATYLDQVFHVFINDGLISVREIDNDGLEYNFITSVSKYKDKVYVTSETGVHYIAYKDFFTYKPVMNGK